jgi:hypothetical protein
MRSFSLRILAKECPVCLTSFSKPEHYSHKQFVATTCCSRQCRNVFSKGRHNSARTEFKVGHPSFVPSAQPKPPRKPHATNKPWLGRTFSPEHRRKLSIAKQGKHPWNWLGRDPDLRQTIRTCPQYRDWRRRVFERDHFTCQICDRQDCQFNADHFPKTFSMILRDHNITTLAQAQTCDELWNIDNARTLCIPCHRNTDSYGFKAASYNKQMQYA